MTSAALLRRRAELQRELATVDEELALAAEREDANVSAADTFTQLDSPLGHTRHLRACRREGLPHTRIGRTVIVKRADFDAWLEAKATTKRARPAAPSADLRAALGLEST